MQYSYTAKSSAGSVTTGSLEAASLSQVQQQLREKGLFALEVKPQERRAAMGLTPRRAMWRKVAKRDLLALTSQLSIMTKAGIDVAGALESAASQCPNPTLRRALQDIHRDVGGGASVSQALSRHVHIFGEAYIASVAAGEAAGKLPHVLQRLAKLLRNEIRLRGTVRGLMTYPVVLATVSFTVLCGLVFFVLPQFAGIFEQFDVPLPTLTHLLIVCSSELRARWWLYIPLVVVSVVGGVLFQRSAVGRRWTDYVMLNLPLVRDVTRTLTMGRIFQLLGIMLESGVPLLEGLQMVRASVQNSLFRDLMTSLEREILNGRGMGETLVRCDFIPSSAAQMVSTGEQTGTLGMVTQTMGEYYEEEGETRLREVAAMIEPLIIVVMGVVVATVVLSVMLPMFDFATLAGKK
ncbi:MAG: type II secretion system F family protein [Pirellulaceae bacterium]